MGRFAIAMFEYGRVPIIVMPPENMCQALRNGRLPLLTGVDAIGRPFPTAFVAFASFALCRCLDCKGRWRMWRIPCWEMIFDYVFFVFFCLTRRIELWFQRKNQMYPANHVRVFADSIARHGKSNTCFGGRSALGDCSQYHSCVMSGWLVYWTCSSWTWKTGWSQWGFNYYSSLPYAVCIPLPSRILSQKTSKDSQFCMVKLSKF